MLRPSPDLSLGFETLALSRAFSPFLPLRRSARSLKVAAVGLTVLVGGTSSLQNAVANGDTRTLVMHHTHSGEDGTFTFKKDGRYDPAVLEKLNWFLRDWRTQDPTKMDPALFDIVWEVYRTTDARAPIQIVSAYRSPKTNAMLRSRSSGVAQFSQHMLGKAMDWYVPGVNLADLRAAGLRLQRGGVGFYPTSGSPFIHTDTGSIRHWPRMTHDQLVRVFPDGKTVHVPTDGKPLSGYATALAEVRARGSSPGVAVASADGGKAKSFFSGFFKKKEADDEEGAAETTVAAAPANAETSKDTGRGTAQPQPAAPQVASAPLPPSRPAAIAVAAIATQQAANFPSAPLPQRRPNEIAVTGRARTASASLAAGPAPLPSVITRGEADGAGEDADTALGYAAMGNLSGEPQSGALPHAAAPVMSAPAATAQPTVAAAPKPRTRAAQVAFGRLFLSPSLASELYLRPPELRVFAAFMTPPREVVAHTFSRDASFGLSAGFSGPAVAELPTYVFRAPPVALTQRM